MLSTLTATILVFGRQGRRPLRPNVNGKDDAICKKLFPFGCKRPIWQGVWQRLRYMMTPEFTRLQWLKIAKVGRLRRLSAVLMCVQMSEQGLVSSCGKRRLDIGGGSINDVPHSGAVRFVFIFI